MECTPVPPNTPRHSWIHNWMSHAGWPTASTQHFLAPVPGSVSIGAQVNNLLHRDISASSAQILPTSCGVRKSAFHVARPHAQSGNAQPMMQKFLQRRPCKMWPVIAGRPLCSSVCCPVVKKPNARPDTVMCHQRINQPEHTPCTNRPRRITGCVQIH